MTNRFYASNPSIERIFNSIQAQNGGVVRRDANSVRRFASIADLETAVRIRGFHLIRNGNQLVIFCNKADLQIIL